MYKLLTKLAQPFVNLNFITKQNVPIALYAISGLSFWPKDYFSNSNPSTIKITEVVDLNVHLEHIADLRSKLEEFEREPNIVENHINEILNYFMPSNKALQSWDKNDAYAKLLVLSQFSYYIKTDFNAKNEVYDINTKYGPLVISINLAKPEKTQAQIIAEKNAVHTNLNEPQCGICIDNLNFHGSLIKPSRENLRVIYEQLSNEKWFFQYSPYAYLNGHFVLNNMVHTPMLIDDTTIAKIFQFLQQHPEFMLGSNADLPIVGGSLLGHNHFQGALEKLPIMQAKSFLTCYSFNCKLELLHWPLNTIRVTSKNVCDCVNTVNKIMNYWKIYTDEDLVNQHNNTVTYIAQKEHDEYICNIILRNNSTSDDNPQGDYHFHRDKFHIKQENIGLMEAGGLAILPGRLIKEFNDIMHCYTKAKDEAYFIKSIINNSVLEKHTEWVTKLLQTNNELSLQILFEQAGQVFVKGLEDCCVLDQENFVKWFKRFLANHPTQIDNGLGLKIEILNIGNIIKQIYLKNKPLLLEYKDPNQYLQNNIILNAFAGPVCGRIEQGKVSDGNIKLQLPVDKDNNYMHGMTHKWSELIYDVHVSETNDAFEVISKTDQTNSDVSATYKITNLLSISKHTNTLTFKYNVTADKKTLCNPSHHFYWTLNSNSILNDVLDFNPSHIWKLTDTKNPFEQIKIDQISAKTLEQWMIDLNQLTNQNAHLIDHPFVLNNGEVKFSSASIQMNAKSAISEIVIYTYFSTYMDLFKYQRNGICFEFQHIPTSLNNQNGSTVLTNKYSNEVTYQFDLKK